MTKAPKTRRKKRLDSGPGSQPQPQPQPQRHPIIKASERFFHRVRGTKFSYQIASQSVHSQVSSEVSECLEVLNLAVNASDSQDPVVTVRAQRDLQNSLHQLRKLTVYDTEKTVTNGFFLNIFSAFDAFTGDLLRALFHAKPELFSMLGGSISMEEIVDAGSKDDILDRVLNLYIEAHRRKSYPEQFKDIGSLFGLKLTDFKNWMYFVEASQRRNLMTHCDGTVTDQYIKVCLDAGYQRQDLPKVGNAITVDGQYFEKCCDLIVEVGLKLCHTLWRKLLPQELAEADQQIVNEIFALLLDKEWQLAENLAQFAADQKRHSSERFKLIIEVNLIQAMKRSGRKVEARQRLQQSDWSAMLIEFQLAKAVLLEEYTLASKLMVQIGRTSSIINEVSYHTWPLFNEFCSTKEFLDAYKSCFAVDFADILKAEIKQVVDSPKQSFSP